MDFGCYFSPDVGWKADSMCTLLLRAKTKKTTKKSLLLRLEQGPEVWGQFGALGRHE